MINSVRNTVLAILNKNNYGYISPQDFNLYAKQAQLDIFEDYFYQYNYQINKENKRLSGTGYADITKGYEEVIDLFSVFSSLTYVASSVYNMPSVATTNSDYYLVNKVLFSPSQGIPAGVASTDFVECERVSHKKITLLNSSLLTSPSEMYPAYTSEGEFLTAYGPAALQQDSIWCQYIRYPQDPQWTYTTLTGGEPVFNQSNPSYQDFELPLDDEPSLVLKILQFAGMSIRELQAVQFGQGLEQYEDNQEK
jgi:hypothetical protein|tara:strand:- start:31941 stop:32696 length:756 start_codon:yes stop_codon:yes gene_type:complete